MSGGQSVARGQSEFAVRPVQVVSQAIGRLTLKRAPRMERMTIAKTETTTL